MNVLGKIVIPRLLLSIAYIISEIEEKAREEFFRMKKIVQLNRKKRMKLVEGDKKLVHDCETCVLCAQPRKDVSFTSKAPEVMEKVEEPVVDHLKDFRKQITDIIAATKDLEQNQLIDETDSFVKQAEELQAHLQARKQHAEDLQAKLVNLRTNQDLEDVEECPEFIPAGVEYEDLCAKCQLMYINQYGAPADDQKRRSLISPPCSSYPTSPTLVGEAGSPSSLRKKVSKEVVKKEVESEYVKEFEQEREYDDGDEGIFQTEIEVITRVLRNIHPDGTITEDKKVIKIRRETKKPFPKGSDQAGRKGRLTYQNSDASYGSGPYRDSKRVGYVIPDKMTPFPKLHSYSENLSGSSSMCYPVARYCVSIPIIICSSDFDVGKGVIDEFKTLSEKIEIALGQYKKSRSNNITTIAEYNSSLNKSETMLLSLLSENTNFNLNNTSHLSLYKDVMVMPDLRHSSCVDVSTRETSSEHDNSLISTLQLSSEEEER